MIKKKVVIFGASGQIGRYCIRRLVKDNYKVIAVTRNKHQKAYVFMGLQARGESQILGKTGNAGKHKQNTRS